MLPKITTYNFESMYGMLESKAYSLTEKKGNPKSLFYNSA